MLLELISLLTTTFIIIFLLFYYKTHPRLNLKEKTKKIIYEEIYKKNTNIINCIKKLITSDYINYEKQTSSNPFSVLSYNILTQRFVKDKRNSNLKENKRLQKITEEIKIINPTIICLQEVTNESLKYLTPIFSDEYKIISHTNEGSPLINFIAIKKNRFTVASEMKVNIQEKNNNINIIGNRGILNLTLKDNLVKDKLINLFCVHFPCRPQYEYEKAKILKLIFNIIIDKKIDNVIIAGDFNSIPNSVVLRMIYYNDWINEINNNKEYIKNFEFTKSEIKLNNDTLQKMNKKENFKKDINDLINKSQEIYNKYHLRSAYDEYYINKTNENFYYLRCHPKYTNYTKNFINTIDYIFFSKTIKKIKILKIPEIEKENSKDYLPNNNHPSDHLKLFALFEYKK